MKSLTIDEMTYIEGGSLLSLFDGLCTGIAIGEASVTLLAAAGVITISTGGIATMAIITLGCGGYAIYRNW